MSAGACGHSSELEFPRHSSSSRSATGVTTGMDVDSSRPGIPMNPDRWRQVAEVYEAALEREPAARGSFLAGACRGDSDLLRAVESLLAQEHTPLVVDHGMLTVAAAVLEGTSPLEPGTALGPYRVEALIGV